MPSPWSSVLSLGVQAPGRRIGKGVGVGVGEGAVFVVAGVALKPPAATGVDADVEAFFENFSRGEKGERDFYFV